MAQVFYLPLFGAHACPFLALCLPAVDSYLSVVHLLLTFSQLFFACLERSLKVFERVTCFLNAKNRV